MNGGNRATKTYDPLWVGQPIPELHSMAVRPARGRGGGVASDYNISSNSLHLTIYPTHRGVYNGKSEESWALLILFFRLRLYVQEEDAH